MALSRFQIVELGEKEPGSCSEVMGTVIVREVCLLNVFMFCLVLLLPWSRQVTVYGGILIICYLLTFALINPSRTFFLAFGIKFTFDALWVTKGSIPGFQSVGLLEMFGLPVLLLVILRIGHVSQSKRWPVSFALIYLLWVVLSMTLNGYAADIELIIRQSGIVLGLIAGIAYVQNKRDFDLLACVVFISTIVPVLMSFLQIIAYQGNVVLFHYKMDAGGHLRFSGLYYDPGTTGMICLVSIICLSHLVSTRFLRGIYEKLFLLALPMGILILVTGGTRSVIAGAILVLLSLYPRKFRLMIWLTPALVAVVLFSKPYFKMIHARTSADMMRSVETSELLQEEEYRTMLSGRVGLWQDVVKVFQAGSDTQRFFGSGRFSNAHSSYFFLLLEIGYFGLAFYLIFQVLLCLAVLRADVERSAKAIILVSLMTFLLVGVSLNTVIYTSFQWTVYAFVGSLFNLSTMSGKVGIVSRHPTYNIR